MINLTTTHLTRIASSAALGAMSTMGMTLAQSGAYLPSADVVVVEMEDLAEAAGWSASSSLAGFAGRGYVEWSGPDMAKKPGTGLVGFETCLETAGSYELRLHNRHDAPDVTDANDVWLRVDGGEWTKVFSSFRGEWTWDTRQRSTEGNVGPVILDLKPGTHKIELSGRSQGFMVDRVHLFKQGTTNALSTTRAVSSRVPATPAAEVEAATREQRAAEPIERWNDAAHALMYSEDRASTPDGAPEARSPESEAAPAALESVMASGKKPVLGTGKTLPVSLVQPRRVTLSADDALTASKIRARAGAADDARRGGPKGPSVSIFQALEPYIETALGRGVSRFDLELALEGTNDGPGTAFSQGPFVAKNYLENTADQNKGLRIRALRMNREPRAVGTALSPISQWPGGDIDYGDTLCLVPPMVQWGFNVHLGSGPVLQRETSLTWDNISVRPDPGPGESSLIFGTREYNVPDRRFVNCDFTEINIHGAYVSSNGDTTMEGCTFLRNGAQGAQFSHRSNPAGGNPQANFRYVKSPTHTVRDCHFIDNGHHAGWASFSLTYASPGSSEFPGSLLIEDSSFVCKLSTPRSDGRESTGALLVCRDSGNVPLDPALGQMMSDVTIRNCLFDYTNGDRSIADLKSIDELVIEECCFIARDHTRPNIWVDKDWSGNDLAGTRTQRIVLRDNVSNGVSLKIHLANPYMQNAQVATFDLHCPGEEVVIDAVTGEEISRQSL